MDCEAVEAVDDKGFTGEDGVISAYYILYIFRYGDVATHQSLKYY